MKEIERPLELAYLKHLDACTAVPASDPTFGEYMVDRDSEPMQMYLP
jgi:hypothetical protein